jgi:hypothetical protein
MAVDIVPWVKAPDYAQIMQAGTTAGLSARRIAMEEEAAAARQAEAESSAADRLKLAYDQIASQERRASEAAMARREQAQAALKLRESQSRDLNAYRLGQLQAREESNARQTANMLRLGEQFQQREQRMADQFGAGQEAVQSRFETREDRLAREKRESAAGALEREERGANRAVARMELNAALREAEIAKRAMTKIEEEGGPRRGMFGLTAGTTKAYEALKAQKEEAESRVEKLKREGSSMSTSGGASLMPRVTTQEDYDELKSGTAYISTNGKVYVKP